MSHFYDVTEFQKKFGILVSDKPTHLTQRKLKERVEFLLEELRELAEAGGLVIEPLGLSGNFVVNIAESQQGSLADQADALVDLVYVAIGTAVSMGLPWQTLWNDVHRANMAKVSGVAKRGHAVDCVKPAGWVPPQGDAILAAAGFDRNQAPETYRDDI